MPAKNKRRVSAATIARLRELRRKNGLGEFATGDPFRGKRRGKKAARPVRSPMARHISTTFAKLGIGLGF